MKITEEKLMTAAAILFIAGVITMNMGNNPYWVTIIFSLDLVACVWYYILHARNKKAGIDTAGVYSKNKNGGNGQNTGNGSKNARAGKSGTNSRNGKVNSGKNLKNLGR